ncbi:MAG TPA: tetratricopeptide repeat protein [Candidatus Sulfotelmatobacter sp.]|nr:tetratricopeptide repeat protein [Candidatus Sulfotelmatobacter sp.]
MACLLLALGTLALYNPVNRHPFVNYDDDRYITENPRVREGLTGETFRWALTSTEQANWHPLTWMSHAIDCSLFGLNPAGHHFTSVLLHAVNGILLFLLLLWATGRALPSLFAAALFALHPINVESVAWVAERKNVLCTFYFLLALWAYGWFARKPGWKRYLVVFGAFAAGLAAKPMAITLPFVLLLLDYWPLDRLLSKNESSATWARLVAEKVPLFALSAASAVITVQAQRAGGSVRGVAEFSLPVRFANAIHAYGMYLWKMLWPARLAPLYPHPGDSLSLWRVMIALVILLLVSVAVWKHRSRRYLLTGWLWFLGTLVPVIGLVQVGEAAMADRYAYIPLIGIFVMIAFGAGDFTRHTRVRFWPALAASMVLAALALTTHRQIGYWRSNYELWTHTLAVTGNNFVAEDNLGGALILENKEEEAYPHFLAAARINPRDPMSHSNLGTYDQNHGRMREAAEQYEAAVNLTSDPGLLALTYANLGAVRIAVGEPGKAYEAFQQSLERNPTQFNAWLGLGLLAERQGNLNEAISDFSRSLEAQPTAQGFLELGRCLAQTGRTAEALRAYDQALTLSPDLTEAQTAAAALRSRNPDASPAHP